MAIKKITKRLYALGIEGDHRNEQQEMIICKNGNSFLNDKASHNITADDERTDDESLTNDVSMSIAESIFDICSCSKMPKTFSNEKCSQSSSHSSTPNCYRSKHVVSFRCCCKGNENESCDHQSIASRRCLCEKSVRNMHDNSSTYHHHLSSCIHLPISSCYYSTADNDPIPEINTAQYYRLERIKHLSNAHRINGKSHANAYFITSSDEERSSSVCYRASQSSFSVIISALMLSFAVVVSSTSVNNRQQQMSFIEYAENEHEYQSANFLHSESTNAHMNNDGSIAGQQLDSNEHNKRELISHNGISSSSTSSSRSFKKTFTNQYAIRIEGGDPNEADRLAIKYGYINLGVILPGEEYFLFEDLHVRKRSSRRTRSAQTAYITREPHVQSIEQQVAKKRVKRGFKPLSSPVERRFPVVHQHRLKGNQLGNDLDMNVVAKDDTFSELPTNGQHDGAGGIYNLNDPLWSDMWYLNRATFDRGMDHNVKEAWDLGYTGRGIVVTILDDGLERTHPDIAPNYDAKASYDVNDRDDDPTPRYEYTDENRHGTRCAGEVAAISNNSLCIVGIAYNARIGGIRMLDGDVTDAVEATSLGHNLDHIDIYSASWGPDDDGRTVDGPAKLTRKAFEKGIKEGRRGRGSIFVWASGNGGKDADSCNCDGYTNSIYTLSISSATEHGNIPWYSEACSSTLATAYSSGATGEKMIVTTDLHHSCTNAHTGTSASAPLAAGIVALTLEANPTLTWRDLQHIVVRTARPLNLRAGDWITNGVGRNVSHSFGFGLMDAGAMVKLASNWSSVPEQHKCIIAYPARYKTIPHGNRLQLQLYTDGCAGETLSRVIYLEHVQSIITLTAPKRGDIQIYLTSPSGTRSTLLAKRARDTSRTGFREWAFMTTHNWGEMAPGLWTLEIDNDGWDDAELIRWDLVMYGTAAEVGPSGGMHSSILMARSISDGYHSDILLMDSSNGRSLYLNAFNFLNLFIFIVYNNIIWCNLHSSCI